MTTRALCVSEVLANTLRQWPERPALRVTRDGTLKVWSWADYSAELRKAAKSMIALGLEPGRAVSILGPNSPEWVIADVASILAGGKPAGIYVTSSEEQCAYVAEHSDSQLFFASSGAPLDKAKAVQHKVPGLKAVVELEGQGWKDFLELGSSISDEVLDARIAEQKASDVCTLIYTSGTTGNPKGVMISHENLTWSAAALKKDLGFNEKERCVSYLPLSHIAEQILSVHGPLLLGSCVTFSPSFDAVVEHMLEVRPTYFMGVPRVWEKIEAKMKAAGESAPTLRKKLVAFAKKVGLEGGSKRERGESLPFTYTLMEKLVYSKVRDRLGLDQCKLQVSGAAPIAVSTQEYFRSLGIEIYNVYGLSESSAAATFSKPSEFRIGTAGKPVPGSQVRIAEDGEILIKGPHVFAGYWKDEEATRAAIDPDGWFHSGDIGTLSKDGFLSITDRKKDLLITAGGENVAPQVLEGMLKGIPGVANAVVVGDGRKYLAALLTLEEGHLKAAAAECGSSATSLLEASTNKELHIHFQKKVDGVNERLARVQTIKKISILPVDFSVEGGELTATMKVKRKIVGTKYAKQIEELYKEA
jgi:long-subunit acyl-CoA synthetase (AMP-forming)